MKCLFVKLYMLCTYCVLYSGISCKYVIEQNVRWRWIKPFALWKHQNQRIFILVSIKQMDIKDNFGNNITKTDVQINSFL